MKVAKPTDEVGTDPFIEGKKERKKKKEIQLENTKKNKRNSLIQNGKILPEKLEKKVTKEHISQGKHYYLKKKD
jgi:hypothetical protein